MSTYPDWVKQYRVRGTAVKKVGNKYYLYKHTSKYVKGKKYPQCVDKYLGIITPDGVIYSKKKNISLENVLVYEYGFSKALLSLCPDEWKRSLGNDWYPVLMNIIKEYSGESYLLKDVIPELSQGRNMNVQKDKLLQYINMDELLLLKTVYLLVFEEREAISNITVEQQDILDKYDIDLGGVFG